jgi:putative ABC transport system ATP-binding protein
MITTFPTPGVRCRNLVKEYGRGESRVLALRGVDLDIAPGELTLLVGPSGCGKTTLISILAGTLDATSGAVSVLGADLTRLSKREKTAFRAKNVGFVFQQFNLLPALTAAENVAVPLVINGLSRAAAVARATEILKAVGLADKIRSLPAQLSGGQQQRVAIARALVHRPHLLVADEPTSAVDARTGQAVMELIREVALQTDRVAVVVTHDPRVFGFADRIVTLEDGRVVDIRSQETGVRKQESGVRNQETEQPGVGTSKQTEKAQGLLAVVSCPDS